MGESQCEGKPWGFLAADIQDAPECVSSCRQKFLGGLLPQDETLKSVCEHISDNGGTSGANEDLWELYCCDSQLCGVDNLKRSGNDPNVNWIVNTCQNIGYSSVHDPGPPKGSYSCSLALFRDGPWCQKEDSAAQTSTSSRRLSGFDPTSSTAKDSSSMATSTQTAIRDPSLEASIDPSSGDDDDSIGEGGLSTGVKVTVALCSVVGIALVAVAIFCILRRRCMSSRAPHRQRTLRQLIKRDDRPPGSADSPTPLVSPTASHAGHNGIPLTPPPPLKERKVLDIGPSSRPSSAGAPRTRPGFPSSPVFAPTMTKISPRTERYPRSAGNGFSPPTSPLGWVTNAEGQSLKGSLRSFSSNPTTTASMISAAASTNTERAPCNSLTPARPRRPGDLPLDIPRPGPPPTRALPSTPPCGPVAQSSGPGPPIQHGDIGVAIGVVSHNPANGVVLKEESQDLCELTEQYGLRNHDSGDSWTQSGGATTTLPKKCRSREVSSPVMEENDLERLGGRY